jgi:DNA-binding HxlR family transcriptional regulator
VEATSSETGPAGAAAVPAGSVCPRFHEAVELIGRRWSGAILFSLIDGPLYFRDIANRVDGLSDRLLSQRLRELETEGLIERGRRAGEEKRPGHGARVVRRNEVGSWWARRTNFSPLR